MTLLSGQTDKHKASGPAPPPRERANQQRPAETQANVFISRAVKVKGFTHGKVTHQGHPAEEGGGGGDSCAGELAEDLVSHFS